MGIVSGLNDEGAEDPQRHQRIKSLVKGLQEIFGPRAEDIARNQHAAATAGSEAAEAWRRILEEILRTPSPHPPSADDVPSAEPLQP